MATKRIKDITTTATSTADDDYFAIDGATNGTRKIAASDVGRVSDVQVGGVSVVSDTIAEIPDFTPVSGNTRATAGLVPATTGGHATTDDVRVFTDEGWKNLPSYLDTSSKYPAKSYAIADYCQPRLQSGSNIKTINNTSLLGSGNISVAEKETWNGEAYDTAYTDFSKTGGANQYQLVLANASDATTYNAMRIKAYYQDESNYGWTYPLVVTGFYINVTSGIIRVRVKSIDALSDSTTQASYFASGKVHFYTPFEVSEVLIDH